ncbi:MAG: hypothetical protein M3044_09875 [Thermoproteota archaeon]|nr:hypothetical protein [Thermoproteota archaeon]
MAIDNNESSNTIPTKQAQVTNKKKLRTLILSTNVNDYDTGEDSKKH